jgi:hypothetical protein
VTSSSSPTNPPPAPTDEMAAPMGGPVFSAYRRTQLFVLIACLACFALFWWAGRALSIPSETGFEASLLQQPHWQLDLLATYVLFVVCLVLGTIIAGWSWFFAGLFAASIGLIAFSARGGAMKYVLFHAASAGSPKHVYLMLAAEQCLLMLPVAIAWVVLHGRYESALNRREKAPAGTTESTASVMPLALLTQIVAMGFTVLLFVPTDAKKQVLIGVFIAAFVGSALAEHLFPDRRAARLFWVGPLVVGLIGYLMAYSSGADFTIGSAQGALAALARPLPLDYASGGVAGALLGYWVGAERPELAFSILAGAMGSHAIVTRTQPAAGTHNRGRQAAAPKDPESASE